MRGFGWGVLRQEKGNWLTGFFLKENRDHGDSWRRGEIFLFEQFVSQALLLTAEIFKSTRVPTKTW